MKWKLPPIIKVYEALGCLVDGRLEIEGQEAKIYSSSKGKFYKVAYDPGSHSIMCNDNGSFYVGYLGYPAIAYLMKTGKLEFSQKYALALKDIHWKDINQKNKNDFEKTQEYVDSLLVKRGIILEEFKLYLQSVLEQIKVLDLNLLGDKEHPPEGY